ncbi:MAG: rod shape-determining protein MreC [Acidobacteriales bacterium]|nr:rod shape-determining protein MreC [Terriglobales bacterium]
MESFFSRYRNPSILALVLLIQILGLAVQVKRPIDPDNPDAGTVRLFRSWVVGAITPVEQAFASTGRFFRRTWHDYINVVGLRSENHDLREQNEKLRLELARHADSANQAQRLQALLDFKQRFLASTVAAQVVGSSGSEQSRLVYIDKGARHGLRPGMAVITPHGIVGKVRDVYRSSAQVLMINDASSGVGAIVEGSRLHGVVKGTPAGEVVLAHIMADEKVSVGEGLVTSGGDRIFPKGLPVGTVSDVSRGQDLFLNVRIKPAANLSRLEEVLVITEMQGPNLESAEEQTPVRAADLLADRLPSVPKKPEPPPKTERKTPPPAPAAGNVKPAPATANSATPGAPNTATAPKPSATGTATDASATGTQPPSSAPATQLKPAASTGQTPATPGEAPATKPDTPKPVIPKPVTPKPNSSSPPASSPTANPEQPAAKPPVSTPSADPAKPERNR